MLQEGIPKNTVRIAVISVLLAVSFQTASAQSNGIKVNMLAAAIKTADLVYERSVAPSMSVQIGALYSWASVPPWSDEFQINGYAITPGCRLYFNNHRQLHGFFVGPFLRYLQMDLYESSTELDGTIKGLGIGSDIGYQWLVKQRYAIEVFLGPMYLYNEIKAEFDIEIRNPIWFKTGISFGYAF